MTKTNQEMVAEFHASVGVVLEPGIPSDETIRLRMKLIKEEAVETIEAISNLAKLIASDRMRVLHTVEMNILHKALRAHLLKELADLLYVAYGTADIFDLPLDAAYAEVHSNNMSKLGPDGKPIRREDGKVLKPEGYKPCDLKHLIKDMI